MSDAQNIKKEEKMKDSDSQGCEGKMSRRELALKTVQGGSDNWAHKNAVELGLLLVDGRVGMYRDPAGNLVNCTGNEVCAVMAPLFRVFRPLEKVLKQMWGKKHQYLAENVIMAALWARRQAKLAPVGSAKQLALLSAEDDDNAGDKGGNESDEGDDFGMYDSGDKTDAMDPQFDENNFCTGEIGMNFEDESSDDEQIGTFRGMVGVKTPAG